MSGKSVSPQRNISCDQWLQVLDELNIGAFTVDMERRITAINYSAQALMGLQDSEVLGRDCREIFTGVPCLVQCIFREGQQVGGLEPAVEFAGEEDAKRMVSRVATPLYDAAGEIIGCLTVLQDHSPIVDLIDRVHYESRSLNIILDNLDIGIFTVNRGGLITFFNQAAERISGYSRRDVLGKSCVAIFESDTADDVCKLKESMLDGSARSSRQGEIITAEGENVPIEANYLALRNEKGTIVGGLATFKDLTLVHQLDQAISNRYTFHDMIGRDPAMSRIFEMVRVVAPTDATVLIEGATGTGKDLLAGVIHSASPRSGRAMVKVNCAALPDNLLESEMFGYARGAFTGADRDKPGRFQDADGGTIFLDEIGDLPLGLQAKLLRVIEDREFYPLGSRRTTRVDVRVLSASNRRLEELVARGLFREDLFYRLNVVRIELPPLRQRRSDLPLLIRHITRRLSSAMGKPMPALSERALKILLNYDYPGNVRELENILEHALIICQSDAMRADHLPDYLGRRTRRRRNELRDVHGNHDGLERERRRILDALRQHQGNRRATARALGIDRSTLWRRMKKLDLLS